MPSGAVHPNTPINMQRMSTRCVTVKTEDQLGLQALHRVRSRLVGQRTAVINQIRGFLLEHGIAVRQGLRFLRQQLPDILAKRSDVLSPRMIRIMEDLSGDGNVFMSVSNTSPKRSSSGAWQRKLPPIDDRLCLSEIKLARTDDEVRREMALCPVGKSYPDILVVQPAENWAVKNCPARSTARENGASFSKDRCVPRHCNVICHVRQQQVAEVALAEHHKSRHSRRIEPIRRSAYPFCHGERSDVG